MTQAMLTGRINKHMSGKVGYKGNTYTNKDFYNLLIQDGYTKLKATKYSDGTTDYDLQDATGCGFQVPKMIFDNPESIGL